MGKMRPELALTLALLAASAAPAAAQPPRHGTTRAGEEIIVEQSASGEELRGRLVELSPTSLTILVDGRRVDVPIDNVLRIDTMHDSVKNGAIIGASVFAGLAAIACAEFGTAA